MTPKEKFVSLLSREELAKGDALFLLQGDGLYRAPRAVELYKKGFAPLVAIVGSADNRSYGSFPSGEVRDEMIRLGLPEAALHVEEVGPNTLGEARRAMALARERGWKTMLIVTSPYHQYRAFLTFLKAMRDAKLDLRLINAVAPLPMNRKTPWGIRAELLHGEFEKIAAYQKKGDVASYEDGIAYLQRQSHDLKDVTAVICTLNEEENIEACIRSVQANKIARIVVVDASSTDRTVEIARSLGAECHVLERYTLARQRQFGVEQVKTKYVCLVDADNRPESDCIEKLVCYLEKNGYVGVGARKLRVEGMRDYWSKGWEWHNEHFLYTPGPKLAIGTLAVYRADVVRRIGYDTDLVAADDNVLCYKLRKRGYIVAGGPGVCREHMASTFRQFKQKLRGYGKGDAEFFMKFPEKRFASATHVLWNHVLKGIGYALIRGRFDLVPYYLIYGAVRYSGFFETLITVALGKRSLVHPGYADRL